MKNFYKKDLFYLNNIFFFLISFLICIIFYLLEGLIKIDRFYHPDSLHYLHFTDISVFNIDFKNILNLRSAGYYILSILFKNNYFGLIILNFVLYSLTNLLIYRFIFKRYILNLEGKKLHCLFFLLFLDPYRIHLACHVLKETFLIFIMVLMITSNTKLIKILMVVALEIVRAGSVVYFFIFLRSSYLKIIFFLVLFLAIIISISLFFNPYFFDGTKFLFLKIFNNLEVYHYRDMSNRDYDHISTFRDYNFIQGFLLKNITWPLMFLSGTFIFFVSSKLFQFLGIIIIINHILIYFIAKKTFVNLGLLLAVITISAYTSSYTAMFRYSYLALYFSMILFFLNFNIKSLNKNMKQF
jgi:hypothetical protein